MTFAALRESAEEGGGILFEMQVRNTSIYEFKDDLTGKANYVPKPHMYTRSDQSNDMNMALSEHTANFVMLPNGQVNNVFFFFF